MGLQPINIEELSPNRRGNIISFKQRSKKMVLYAGNERLRKEDGTLVPAMSRRQARALRDKLEKQITGLIPDNGNRPSKVEEVVLGLGQAVINELGDVQCPNKECGVMFMKVSPQQDYTCWLCKATFEIVAE